MDAHARGDVISLPDIGHHTINLVGIRPEKNVNTRPGRLRSPQQLWQPPPWRRERLAVPIAHIRNDDALWHPIGQKQPNRPTRSAREALTHNQHQSRAG